MSMHNAQMDHNIITNQGRYSIVLTRFLTERLYTNRSQCTLRGIWEFLRALEPGCMPNDLVLAINNVRDCLDIWLEPQQDESLPGEVVVYDGEFQTNQANEIIYIGCSQPSGQGHTAHRVINNEDVLYIYN